MESTHLNTVGILGGGQLARMLAESAFRLGLHPIVFAHHSSDPAAQLCPDAVFGNWQDPVPLRRFFSQISVAAFENEFVPCEILEQASDGLNFQFLPDLKTLYRLQDKLRQKDILNQLGIPSAEYEALPPNEDATSWVKKMMDRFQGDCVFKWARQGYDGKGTKITSDSKEAALFCKEAELRKIPVFVEKKIPFCRELAMVASYSTRGGELATYPLVITQQHEGICRLVTGPATSLGVSLDLESMAREYAKKLAKSLSLYGTFAIELFQTPEGELLVNELAPRVHNSGHFTQDACNTSQFENHWRSLLGLPLGKTESAPAFAMLNLIGPKGIRENIACTMPIPTAQIHLHWYGKAEMRVGRKLGHLNGSTRAPEKLPELVRSLENCAKDWIRGVTNG